MKVISLGWGVQSFTLAAMSAVGELPPVDAAIHADTTHERAATYEFAQRWTPWLEKHGVRVVTVRARAERTDPCYSVAVASIFLPLFTMRVDGVASGLLRRQCTNEWKVSPIHRWLQANRNGAHVEQSIGISLDEALRMKAADVSYVTNMWPLVDRRMTRWDCMRWLREHELEVPSRSSCVFCPFHDRASWRAMKRDNGPDWQAALELDEKIRHKRPGYICYLTAQLKPLADCDFSNAEDHGQLALWDEECTGYCFL